MTIAYNAAVLAASAISLAEDGLGIGPRICKIKGNTRGESDICLIPIEFAGKG